MSLYALVSPSRKIIAETVGFDRQECEGCAFRYMARRLGVDWESRHWKNWKSAQADIKKRGYTIKKVRLVLA